MRPRYEGALALAALTLGACSPSAVDTARVDAFLHCDDCEDAQLDSVVVRGLPVVYELAGALRGPHPERIEVRRIALGRSWQEINALEPSVDSATYVDQYLSNYRAHYQRRAALALGEMSKTGSWLARATAIGKLKEALHRDATRRVVLRSDIRELIEELLGPAFPL